MFITFSLCWSIAVNPVLQLMLNDPSARRMSIRLGLFKHRLILQVEDDSLTSDDIAETGYRDESGEMRRPWCPATRILEHRESQAQEAEAESRRKAQQQSYCNPDDIKTQLREDFPAIQVISYA